MSSAPLRELIIRAHQQSPNCIVLAALDIDTAGIDDAEAILKILLATFSDCLKSDERPTIQCHCEIQSRWRQNTTEPSQCLILAQRLLAAAGLMQYLLDGIKSGRDDSRCAWMMRLAYAMDVVQTSATRCAAASAISIPNSIPTWNTFYEALLHREQISEPIMAVFFELLVNRIAATEFQCSQGCQARFVRAPWVVPVIVRLLQRATLPAWRLALNNFAYLFENESSNVDAFSSMKNWQESILRLLRLPEVGVLSCRKSDNFLDIIGNDSTIFNFKMLVNIFSMVVMRHLWNKRDGTRSLLRQITENVEKEFGYGDIESAAIIRVIFYVLCNRFRHFTTHQIQKNPVALPNAIKLIEAVEQFVFYQGGLSKYCMDYKDIMLHIALDGKANADKELLSAAVQLCEFVHKNAVPKDVPSSTLPSETRTMMVIISHYLALLSDAACLFSAPSSSNSLLESVYLLKKNYLQSGIGQKYKKATSPISTEDIELTKALRYQIAEEMQAKGNSESDSESPMSPLRRVSVINNRRSTEVNTPTVSARSGARRMVFLVESFGSPEAALNAAERYSGRIRHIFRVEKDFVKTKKGEADNMLPISAGNLVSILALDVNAKLLLGSFCNQIGFLHKSYLSPVPVGFEVDVALGKRLPISLSSPTPNTLLSNAESIISPLRLDETAKRPSVLLQSQDEPASNQLASLIDPPSIMQRSDSVLPTLEITSIPEKDVMVPDSLLKTMISLGKHHDSTDSAYKSMDFNVDALHLSHVRSGSSRSVDMSMELIAEMNSLKSGFTGIVSNYSSRSPTKDSHYSGPLAVSGEHPAKINFGFVVRTQEEICESISLEAVVAMVELGISFDQLPSEIRPAPSLVESAKAKIEMQPKACDMCTKPLSSLVDIHRLDGKTLCLEDYLTQCGDCEVCRLRFSDAANTKRLPSGSRIHKSCAVCSECPDTPSDCDTADIEWQGLLYCKPHFLSLFWKSCTTCKEVVVGKFTDVAGCAYHDKCVCCTVCKANLLDDTNPVIMLSNNSSIFCETDARQKMLDLQCGLCQQEIWDDDLEDTVKIFPYRFHIKCVSCSVCGSLPSKANYAQNPFYLSGQDPLNIVCSTHSAAHHQIDCLQCGKRIESEIDKTLVGSLCYHISCVQCSVCKMSLVHRTIYRQNGKLICRADYDAIKSVSGTEKKEHKKATCESCGLEIKSSREGVKIKGKKLHQACVKCSVCNEQLGVVGQTVYIHRRKVLCSLHYNEARAMTPDFVPASQTL